MNKNYSTEELDYIAVVARKFCNLYESGWEKLVVENALNLFRRRSDRIDCSANFSLYKSTVKLQEKINKYGIDSNKFWLLLLFLKDYTESCFGKYYIFDKESIGDNLKKMITMLDNSWNCELTISNNSESAHIDVMFFRNELKELLLTLPQKMPTNIYLCIGKGEDNVLWHKVKFFMEMLDFFFDIFIPAYQEKTSGRKDWSFTAQILYIVGYLEEEKYLLGYEVTERTRKDIDGNTTVVIDKTPVKNIGKYIKDNTKCCKSTPNCVMSHYCYNPYSDMID